MRSLRGVSLVDVVVGSALFLIIFVALFGILRASIAVSGLSKLKAAATSIATSQVEYIRSLEYNAVGTDGGIPAGSIPQNATTTQAGLEFSVRTYIVYADDPADGEGVLDSNGITTDYKRVKVEVSYTAQSVSRSVVLLTNIVPPGIETTVGGGTLRVNVVDAFGVPISGATVRVVNDVLSPVIDVSTFSDSTGAVLFGGAPTSTEYQVYVSKDGYSSEETHERDAVNVNPTPGYLTVAESQTTTGTFAIDLLSTLTLRTFSPIEPAVFYDGFADNSKLHTESNVVVSGDALVLSGGVGSYVSSGSALSSSTAPTYLASWVSASSTLSVLAGTTATFRITDDAGTPLPDAVLPGNSSGFTSVVDLSGVSTTTYPALRLEASLSTSDPLVTPSVLDWELGYTHGPLPLGNVPVTLTGAKTIGSDTGGLPIYKTSVATTTDETGLRSLTLEWDSYTLSVTGFTIDISEPTPPYEVLPNTTVDAVLILTP